MKLRKLLYTPIIFLLILAACTSQAGQTPGDNQGIKGETIEPGTALEETEGEERETPAPNENLTEDSSPPPGAQREFTTDFSVHAVPYDEILSGGPSKDGIPAVDNPQFISVEEADQWLDPREPVMMVSINQAVKAYPIQILMWHEIVNDTLGGTPIVVTFCPLCNTAIVFERTVNDQVLDFGTTGRLRYSNLIMYDRQTETWWQQGTGEGIVGEQTGTQLEFVPIGLISWETFKDAHPDSLVLSRDTGHNKPYGTNPYTGYDDIDNIPFLYQGPETPGDLPSVARILGMEFNGEPAAFPYNILSESRVVNGQVGGQNVVVFWEPGTASALDSQQISEGRDVGAAIAFDPTINGQELTFQFDGENIVDNETGSTWDFLGIALSGPLQGEQLEQVVANNYFWFAWAAFKPETRLYQP